MVTFPTWPWRHWASCTPQAPALYLGHRVLNWQDLQQQIDDCCACFQYQGVESGMGVALRGKNSPQLLIAYLALLQCGARLLALNPTLPATQLATVLPNLTLSFYLDLAESLIWPETITALSLPDTAKSATQTANMALPDWDAQRIATMTLTSGSSGLPKAVVHHYAAHLNSAEGVRKLLAFEAGDRWLLSLPLFHVSGQGILWRWLSAGACLSVQDLHPLADALQACTHASLVPTQLWRLLAQEQTDNLMLKAVLLGGAMIPVALTQAAEARGIRCYCGYGMTEMASTVTAKRADGLAGVGVPLAGRDICLQQEEIWIRSTTAALGYWIKGEIHPLVDEDGWYHSRDRGVMEQGELRVLGRLDNQFFSAGEGIQPEEIERVIATYPGVKQVFLVPRHDDEYGARPVAVIDADSVLDYQALAQWLQPKLATFQRPVVYYALPAEFQHLGIKIPRQRVIEWVAKC